MVLLSGLKPDWLRMTAGVMVLHGADDGTNIRPGVARIAQMLGKSPRTTQRYIAELRRLNILVSVSSGRGGRNQSTVYRLNESALPQNHDTLSDVVSRGNHDTYSDVVTDENHDTLSDVVSNETANARASETLTTEFGNHDKNESNHDTQVSPDRCTDRYQIVSTAPKTARFPHLAKAPNGNNVEPIRKLGYELLDERPELEDPDRLTEFAAALKDACAAHRIDYGRSDEVSFRVAQQTAEHCQGVRGKLKATKRKLGIVAS
jgi:hypothetical protein